MEKITTKVIDNTFISACIKEINSINLLECCSKKYNLSTSSNVYEETKKGFNRNIVDETYANIEIIEMKDEAYNEILLWYEDRYPYLHRGELSSFLLAVLEYLCKNKRYYYITDDNRMRKTINNLLEDSILVEKVGEKITKFNVTGTIGLIHKLKAIGLLLPNQLEGIIKDLNTSTFYITSKQIEELRR
ncbi:MAG: hypothetical protein ACFFDT_06850 [Candidatus Hodarchaeota archaeon]